MRRKNENRIIRLLGLYLLNIYIYELVIRIIFSLFPSCGLVREA